MLGTAEEVRTESLARFSHGVLLMDTIVWFSNRKFYSSVWALGPVKRTCKERCSIGIDGKEESKECVLFARLDDDDDDERY